MGRRGRGLAELVGGAGVHLQRGANPLKVVLAVAGREGAQPYVQPMILIPSHVLQADQPGRTRHHQIEITVAVEIGGHQRGRVPRRSFDRQRLEGGLRDRPPLAQDHDPVRTGGGEVEPAVVVRVEGEHGRETLSLR